jgi:hypothetical protein
MMRAIGRVIRHTAGALALAAVLLTLTLWARSYRYRDFVQVETTTRHYFRGRTPDDRRLHIEHRQHRIGMVGGHLRIYFRQYSSYPAATDRAAIDPDYPPRFGVTYRRAPRTFSVAESRRAVIPPTTGGWAKLGFWMSREWDDWNAAAPTWPLLLLAGIPAALWLRGLAKARARRRRLAAGQCPACGYDLRGSPPGGPCPECGAAAADGAAGAGAAPGPGEAA